MGHPNLCAGRPSAAARGDSPASVVGVNNRLRSKAGALCVMSGATGRLRLTGRAAPTGDGTMHAWLILECGTLAADPAVGTLGFGILETDGTTVTARPIRIGTDGSFTYRGTRHEPP